MSNRIHTAGGRARRSGLSAAVALGAVLALGACADEAGFGMQSVSMGGAFAANRIIHTAPNELTNEELTEVAKLSDDFVAEAPAKAYFGFDRDELTAEARGVLRQQANWLLRHPRAAVRIYGHTDKVGPESYNEGLGMRRARNAALYLERAGVTPNRFQFVESVGERDPAVDTEAREPRNRRTETIVVGLAIDGGPMRTARVFDGRRAHRVFTRYETDSVEKPEAASTSNVTSQQ